MKTISSKLMGILLVSVFVILTINSLFEFYDEKSKLEREISEEVDIIQHRLAIILPNVLWELNYELAQNIVDVEQLNPNIVSIAVFDMENKVIVKTPETVQKNNKNVLKELILTYGSEDIAKIKIIHNFQKVDELIQSKVNELIVTWVMVIFGLTIIFKLAVDVFIIRHLNRLKEGISSFASGNKEVKIEVGTKDELYYLAEEFNGMRQKIVEEVAKNKEKDKMLAQQAKMAAIGDMISNIAHQWRQPLNSLSLIMQFVKMKFDDLNLEDKFIDSNFQKANDLIVNMSNTIDKFREFYKPGKERSEFSAVEVVEKALDIASSDLEKLYIKVETELIKDFAINGFEGDFVQVLVNLLNNAKDVCESRAVENPEIKLVIDGRYGDIKVCDNGGGIDENHFDKVFEPYFTTKFKSDGTGLGLYMSKVIIETNMGGKLEAENIADGACFTIRMK